MSTLNEDQQRIIDSILSSSDHARIRGRAGTGKTHTFKHLLRALRDNGKRAWAVTPTGAAACRIEDPTLKVFATTIHRALRLQQPYNFGDRTWPALGEFYKKCALGNKEVVRQLNELDTLLIDECSMVGARMFTTMEYIFRKARDRDGEFFGGVQVVFCGDFLQLPPVKDSWLFESRVFAAMNPTVHSLTKIMRTDQEEYLGFQNFIRQRDVPVFDSEAARKRRCSAASIPDNALLLVHTNAEVDTHNRLMEKRLFDGADFITFPCTDQDGERIEVRLCVGMRVMAVANGPNLTYANSSIGTITGWSEEKGKQVAVVKFDDGIETPVSWKTIEYETASGEQRKFSYYPLKPAYAATINKIQGITTDTVAVHIPKNRMDHGRLFVALTRCRTLEGLHLILPDDSRMAFSEKVSSSEF